MMTLTRLLQSMRSNPRRVAFIAVLVLDVCLTLFVFRKVASYADYPFDSDEGFHAQGGLELALDLYSGNWKALFLHASREISDVRVAYVSLRREARGEAARLLEEMRRHRSKYVVVLEGGRPTGRGGAEYEAALGDRLAVRDRRQWSLDFYDMADWMRTSMITRARLRDAMVARHRVLRIPASVYEGSVSSQE